MQGNSNTFLNDVQNRINELEAVILDVIAAIVPWLAPLVPAYIAYDHMLHVLAFPQWLSLVAAVVIEFLGLATVHTAFQFWQWNQTKRKKDKESPAWIAILTGVFYLVIVLVVNVLLDSSPMVHRIAKGLLSLMSVVGAMTLAIRSQHKSQLTEINREKAERRAERKQRKVTGKLPERSESTQEVTGMIKDWRKLSEIEKGTIRTMSTSQIVAKYEVGERTARNWRAKAANGHKNGHKEGLIGG